MELLDQRGLLESLAAPPSSPWGHFGGIPLDFGGLPSAYPGLWKVPQTQLEEVLGAWAKELGAQVRRGHEVQGLTVTDTAVTAEVVAHGKDTTVTGEYLVGCDGEDGIVRDRGGFDFPGTDATLEMLRADITGIRIPDRRFERLHRGLAIASCRAGVTRVMVHEYGNQAKRRDEPPCFDEVAATWERVTGENISEGVPIWLNSFGNASRQAAEYRKGRVLLAGDAAHRQMPVGGQALNLGLQDAVNLGWKLAAAVAGRAATGLLDSYHRERHAVGERVLANIRAQALLLLSGAEVNAVRSVLAELLGHQEVSARLAGMVSGLDIRYEQDDGGLAGTRLPQVVLTTPSGPAASAAMLRRGRAVLLDLSGSGGRHADLTAAAAPWKGQVDVIAAAAEPGSGLDRFGTILVRPDGYIAWAQGLTADPRSALTSLFRPDPVSARSPIGNLGR